MQITFDIWKDLRSQETKFAAKQRNLELNRLIINLTLKKEKRQLFYPYYFPFVQYGICSFKKQLPHIEIHSHYLTIPFRLLFD